MDYLLSLYEVKYIFELEVFVKIFYLKLLYIVCIYLKICLSFDKSDIFLLIVSVWLFLIDISLISL